MHAEHFIHIFFLIFRLPFFYSDRKYFFHLIFFRMFKLYQYVFRPNLWSNLHQIFKPIHKHCRFLALDDYFCRIWWNGPVLFVFLVFFSEETYKHRRQECKKKKRCRWRKRTLQIILHSLKILHALETMVDDRNLIHYLVWEISELKYWAGKDLWHEFELKLMQNKFSFK